jgi:thioredoxin-like negative regulator of GroEL
VHGIFNPTSGKLTTLNKKEIDSLLNDHPEVKEKIFHVDIEEHPDVAELLEIQTIPVCVFSEGNGKYVIRKGMLSKQGIFEWVK